MIRKRLFAAAAFLTRAALPASWQFDAADVGRATLFFPLVGAGLGAFNVAVVWLLSLHITSEGVISIAHPHLPPPLVAVLIVALGAWLTGALHLDGLADMADGFGGGRTREEVLRIMRDHVIGAYGATALVLLLLIKVATIATLVERTSLVERASLSYIILAPALGRWATVPLGRFLPYARRTDEGGGLGSSVTAGVGWFELTGATALAVLLAVSLTGWGGLVCLLAVVVATCVNARICMKRIGGVTGDTLGANTEVCEAMVLIAAVALTG